MKHRNRHGVNNFIPPDWQRITKPTVHDATNPKGSAPIASAIVATMKRLCEEHGDSCMGCGRAYQHLDKTRLGIGLGGVPIMLGQCCKHMRLIADFGIRSVYLNQAKERTMH
jgi:hypothetical protein